MTTMDCDLYGFPVTVCDHEVGRYVFTECNRSNWKPELFKVFDRFLKPGMGVLDIGAYAGATTLYPALKGCVVFAYECDPVAYPVLCQNINLNRLSKTAYPYPDAVCDVPHDVVNFGARGDWGNSKAGLLFSAGKPGPGDTVVPSTTLNIAAIPFNVRGLGFLKINVQGTEASLLGAGRKTLMDLRPVVHVYIRPANCMDPARDIQRLMTALDMYPVISTEDGTPLDRAELSTEAWLTRHDFKIVATMEEWSLDD